MITKEASRAKDTIALGFSGLFLSESSVFRAKKLGGNGLAVGYRRFPIEV